MAKHFQIDTGGTLTTSLAHYWKLDEAAGTTRVDFVGSDNLTDTNTVGQGTGVGSTGNAALFTRTSNQNLAHATATDLEINSADWSLALWVKTTNAATYQVPIGKWTNSWLIDLNGSKLDFYINGGSTYVTTTGSLSSNTWYFIYVYYKHGTGIGISINNGTANTASYTGSSNSGSDTFYVGRDQSVSDNWDGLICQVGMWNKVLVAQELTDLYNSGNGQTMIAGTAYTLTAVAGYYSLVGEAVTFIKNLHATIVYGAYALTGYAVTLFKSKGLLLASGAYTVTGETVSFIKNISVVITHGAYALTGYAAAMFKARVLNAVTGIYTLLGNSVGITGFLSKYRPQGTSFGSKYAPQGTTFQDKYHS
jgi:hypothetical protein